MISRSVFVVSVLASLLPHSFVEGQLQAAWKLRQEGDTDLQAFISINNHTVNLLPFLRQMLGGTNSVDDLLALFNSERLNTGSASSPKQTPRHNTTNNSASRTSLAAILSGRSPVEVGIGSSHFDNETWTTAPRPRDDRPVPGEVDVGPDSLLYFKGNQSLNITACRTYCQGFRGFRLAIAKTNATMQALRNYGSIMIDLTIVRHRKTNTPKFVWGDGSELDFSLIRQTEPVMDSGVAATVVIMYSGAPYLNDVDAKYSLPCLCQGSFGTSMEHEI